MDALSLCIAQALSHEQTRAAQAMAAADIAQRIETGEVAGIVESFLETQWQQVLTLAHGHDDQRVLHDALQAMDDVIWSVKPKATAAECKQLLARLPAILAALKAGLESLPPAENKLGNAPATKSETKPETKHGHADFFTRLAQRHAFIASGPMSTRQRIEWAVNVAQKASERRWRNESLAQQENPVDPHMALVDGLHAAHWVQMRRSKNGQDESQDCKVAWISPKRSVFIFIDGGGQDFLSITAEDLAQNFRNQSARIIAPPSLPKLNREPEAGQNQDATQDTVENIDTDSNAASSC